MIKRIWFTALALVLCATTAHAQDAAAAVKMPNTAGISVNAEAAIVMEAMTGRVLFAQDVHKRLPIASTTKIMTALLALEQEEIDAVFEVDADAIRVEGSSMGLMEGDKVTLRALAVGMLLSSGNDAANATAVRLAGTIPAFAQRMNERAREIGMKDSSFETPSGLDGENHYSTAYDMALLAREALRNDRFAEICSQYRLRTSFGNPPYDRWLTNHNRLLNYYEGTVGVKTGFTKKAGRCLVSSAKRNGVQLICVTLDCPNDWSTHENLYNRYFGEIAVEDLAQGLPPLHIKVTGGTKEQVTAVQYEHAQVPVPVRGAKIEYIVKIEPFLYAPVRGGQTVGEVRVLLDGRQVYELTLQAQEEIPLKHPYDEKTPIWQKIGEWLGGLAERVQRKQ